MKPLLVGEAPGPNGNADRPLDGKPAGRLLECMGYTRSELEGVDLGTKLRSYFEVRNLIDRPMDRPEGAKGCDWPAEEAAEAARRFAVLIERDQHVVLLGKRVATAFGIKHPYWSVFRFGGEVAAVAPSAGSVAIIPHPSGIVRLWNDPANRVHAGMLLWQAVGKIDR